MADFSWSDISENMDWGSLSDKKKNLPSSGNTNQNNFNSNRNLGSNARGRGRGRGNLKNTMGKSENPNFAPLGNRLPGKFSNVNYQDEGTGNSDDTSQGNLANSNDAATEEEGNEEPHSYAIGDVADWNDMKQFDDDHDNEWFIAEEKKMAENYGGKFIKVRYTSQGRVGYHCELCLSECNAKKSLELHCGGMKHLKKKDLWEKQKKKPFDVEDNYIGPVPPSLTIIKPKKKRADWEQKTMPPMQPPAALQEPPYMRYDDIPIDRSESYYGKDRYLESSREFTRRGLSPLPRRRFPSPRQGRSPSPRRGRSPSPRRGRMLPISPERKRTYSSSRQSSPPYGHHGGNSRNDGWSEQSRYGHSREKSPFGRYSVPSPPHIGKRSRSPSPSKKLSLAGSPAGALLQKLAECCVKTEGDAELALSVVGALTKSMKEFAYKNNEIKIAELLMEAELKVGTVKALKAGMKMLSTVSSNAIISKAAQLNVAANPGNSVVPNAQYQLQQTQQYGTFPGIEY